MPIEFDPAKDLANQDKHGVSLAMAVELDWEAALVWVDERIEYGEARLIALAPKQLKDMVPLRTLRGRPKSDNRKLLVSVRYSPEVVAYFKSTGDGWQSRMDRVLREYVSRHSRGTQ